MMAVKLISLKNNVGRYNPMFLFRQFIHTNYISVTFSVFRVMKTVYFLSKSKRKQWKGWVLLNWGFGFCLMCFRCVLYVKQTNRETV